MDKYDKYKPCLKEYLRQKGVEIPAIGNAHCFNPGGHAHGDAVPSCKISDYSFICFGCGINGDIYDAVEILEGITDKEEQYAFVEKIFGGGAKPFEPYKSVKEEFKPNAGAMGELENFLKKNPRANEQIKAFLCKRAEVSVPGTAAYPPEIESCLIGQFLYWPGLSEVRRYLSNDILKKSGIPLVNPRTGVSTWEHSGVVMRLDTGYKLHFYQKNYCDNCKKNPDNSKESEPCPKYKKGGFCESCEKRTSKGGKTFPMPGDVNHTLPVIVVEGEMDALSCAASGIKNLFAAGSTNGLTAPKVKQYLLDAPEIILFFDADTAGRKASGIEPLNENDKRKTNIPQIIRRGGYEGKIKLAELPPVSETGYKDQDALIIAGKLDIVTAAIASARDWIPAPPPQKIYTPFEKFNFLSVKRLSCMLKKLEKKNLDEKDTAPFIASCLKAFPHTETKGLLRGWGASESELVESDISPYFILTVIEKHLSRYMVREIEREITPVEEFIKYITIEDTKFDLNFEEIEISQNARNFFYTSGVRSAALMLAEIFDGKIIYNDAKNDKKFYFYDGHIWKHQADIPGIIYNILLSVLIYFTKRKKEDQPEEGQENKKLHTVLNRIEDRRFRRDIEKEFAGLDGVYHNSDDKDDSLHFDGDVTRETLTLLDCVYDFSGDRPVFRGSRPDEYRKNVLPYTMSMVKNTVVDKFWKFMRGNFKNEKTLETFMFYLSLIGSRVQYKYGAFLIGGKNTGKSTTMGIIQGVYKHLIGFMDADVLVPKEKRFANGQGPTPYIAELEGLGASITMETEDGATLNAALWKKLTGDDIIPARGLNESPKKFANTAQIIIGSNMLPKFNKHDESIVERMIVIPFLVNHARDATETKTPKDIEEELKAEYPGIVRVFAEYYIRLKKEKHGKIDISEESETYKSDVIAEVETDLDKFVNMYVSFEQQHRESIKNVYEEYKSYLDIDDNSVKRNEGLSRAKFTKFVLKNYKNHVFESIQRIPGYDKPQRVFIGMRLKTLDEIAEAERRKIKNEGTQVMIPPLPIPEPADDDKPFE